eukprot:TRINITY_DN7831_c0_g1_i1.p1 TRINITY_DN7831_c0_g1~~TRINITY_DN7831_c0_g1_i1.p1  ORF type:complete len:348 (+),score=42.67 TRINITY_DN7831_c0_g1_i1:111-1154(+)
MHPMTEYTPYAQQPHAVSAPPSPPLATWTTEQIVYWMRQSFFDETSCQAFQRQAVDGARLVRLTMLDLQPPLFFGDSNAANRLLSLIAQANSPTAHYAAPAAGVPWPTNPQSPHQPQHQPQYQPQYQPNYQPQYQPQYQPNYPQQPHQPYPANAVAGPVIYHHPQETQAPQTVYEVNQEGLVQIDHVRGSFAPNRVGRQMIIFPIVWIIITAMIISTLVGGTLGNSSPIFAIPAFIFLAVSIFVFYRHINVPGFEFSSTSVRILPFRGEPRDVPRTDIQDVYIRHAVRRSKHSSTHGYMVGLTLRPGILFSGSNKLEMRMMHLNLSPARNIAAALSRLLGLPLQDIS